MAVVAGLLLLLKLGILASFCSSCLGMCRCCCPDDGSGDSRRSRGGTAPEERRNKYSPRDVRGSLRGWHPSSRDDGRYEIQSNKSHHISHNLAPAPQLSRGSCAPPAAYGSPLHHNRPVAAAFLTAPGRSHLTAATAADMALLPDESHGQHLQHNNNVPCNSGGVFEAKAQPMHPSPAAYDKPDSSTPVLDASSLTGGAWLKSYQAVRGARSSLIQQVEAIKAAMSRPGQSNKQSPGNGTMNNPLFQGS